MKKFIVVAAAFACLSLIPFAASAKSNSSKLNKERLEVGRALLEVTSANLPEVIPFYADDIVYFDPIVQIDGYDEMEEFLYRLFGATSDLITEVEDEIAIDDMYMATWTMTGTFVTDPSVPGVPYEAKGMSVIKFRPKTTDVYYQRDYYTEGDIMATIPPLAPVIGGFRFIYGCLVDPIPAPELGCPPAGP